MYRFHWLPNALTVARLLIAVTLPWSPPDWQFWLLVIAAVTEFLDGWLSRWMGAISAFGQLLDPIADKTLVLIAVGMALWSQWLTWPELIGLAARDLTVIGLTVWSLAFDWRNWRRWEPRLSGKIATWAQFVVLLTLFWTRQPMPVLVWPAAALSIWSAIDYAGHAYRSKKVVPTE